MHYIGNKWVEGRGGRFSSKNPATGEVLWEGAAGVEVETAETMERAKAAFPAWSRTPLEKRMEYLLKFKEELQNAENSLAVTISKETGKPLWESHEEVTAMIGKIPTSIEAYGKRASTTEEKIDSRKMFTYHKPHGVCVVLAPFNFPGHLPNGHIIPALLAGNCVVLKSSHYTPLVAEGVFKCWEKVNLPEGVLQLIQGDERTGHYLVTDPKLDGLFFTGSYKTGNELHRLLPPYKIKALEMGGNNPIVVNEVSDLEAAAYLIIQSAFLSAGQRCSCARRLIVVENKQNLHLISLLAYMIQSIRIGGYSDSPEPFMGPLISMESRERLLFAQATLGTCGGKSLAEMLPLSTHAPFITCGLMDVTD